MNPGSLVEILEEENYLDEAFEAFINKKTASIS